MTTSCHSSLVTRHERRDADLFEVDVLAGRVVVVVLNADVTGCGARAALRLELFGARRRGLGRVEIGDGDVVQADPYARAVERDLHRIPLTDGAAGEARGFRQRIDRAGAVVFVLTIADLHLVAVMYGEPFVTRAVTDADKDAGVRRGAGRLEDDANRTIAERLARIPEQAHAAFAAQHSAFG